MEEVKEEFDKTAVCHGCLSVNRTVSSLGDYYKIFYQVLGEGNLDLTDRVNVLLCWECKAILKKFKTFQQKVRNARDMLAEAYLDWKSQGDIYTLSTLGTVKKDNYDLAIDVDYQDASPYITELEFPQVKEEKLVITTDVNNSEEVKDESDQKCEYSESDNDVADTEYTPEVKRTKKTDTHSTVRQQSIRVYEKYANISKGEKINMEDLTKYYVKVHLSEKEMEDLMEKRDRRECSFRKMPYQCMDCNLGYKRLTDFNRHNQFNHCTYEKPVRCLECNKKQPSLVKMEKHWARHTRMFRCLQCYELCRSMGELKKHINRAHTSVYTCKACNVAFSSNKTTKTEQCKKHTRKYGTKTRYTPEMLRQCLEKIKNGVLSQREAAREYSIPRSTIKNKLKDKHTKQVGRPRIKNHKEETQAVRKKDMIVINDEEVSSSRESSAEPRSSWIELSDDAMSIESEGVEDYDDHYIIVVK